MESDFSHSVTVGRSWDEVEYFSYVPAERRRAFRHELERELARSSTEIERPCAPSTATRSMDSPQPSDSSAPDVLSPLPLLQRLQKARLEKLPKGERLDLTDRIPRTDNQNFYTPQNDEFYATFDYGQPKTVTKEIRLLRLHLDTDDGPLSCSLMSCRALAELQDKYSAISYCAGDPRKCESMIINGSLRFNIFANLAHALRQVRHNWQTKRPRKPLFLWVDQICINQSSVTERSHQVSFMRDIYQSAKEVFVCLSTPQCNLKFDSSLKEAWLALLNPGMYALSAGVTLAAGDLMLAARAIIQSPWWTRAWVFQEFVVAKQATFMYNHHFVPWALLLPADAATRANTLVPRPLHGFRHDHPYRCRGDSHRMLSNLNASVPAYAEGLSAAERSISEITLLAIDYCLRSKVYLTLPVDLEDLLVHSQFCSSSDQRDRLYAFIGLVDEAYGIEPDYSPGNTMRHLLVEVAVKIIRQDRNLDLLHYTAQSPARLDGLPSWVPGWSHSSPARPTISNVRDRLSYMKSQLSQLKHRHTDSGLPKGYCESERISFTALKYGGMRLDIRAHRPFSKSLEHRVLRHCLSRRGLAPQYQRSCQVWTSPACDCPLVLKPVGNGYRFVCMAENFLDEYDFSIDSVHEWDWLFLSGPVEDSLQTLEIY